MFRAANDYRMAIVVHMRASVTQKLPYGRDEALIFLNELMPAAPDVVVAGRAPRRRWIMAGRSRTAGARCVCRGRSQARSAHASALFRCHGARRAAHARRCTAVGRNDPDSWPDPRIVFGSDATTPNAPPREAWAALRKMLPLTDDEFQAIANNAPPYMQ